VEAPPGQDQRQRRKEKRQWRRPSPKRKRNVKGRRIPIRWESRFCMATDRRGDGVTPRGIPSERTAPPLPPGPLRTTKVHRGSSGTGPEKGEGTVQEKHEGGPPSSTPHKNLGRAEKIVSRKSHGRGKTSSFMLRPKITSEVKRAPARRREESLPPRTFRGERYLTPFLL